MASNEQAISQRCLSTVANVLDEEPQIDFQGALGFCATQFATPWFIVATVLAGPAKAIPAHNCKHELLPWQQLTNRLSVREDDMNALGSMGAGGGWNASGTIN